MIKHVMADGTIRKDISGLVLPKNITKHIIEAIYGNRNKSRNIRKEQIQDKKA